MILGTLLAASLSNLSQPIYPRVPAFFDLHLRRGLSRSVTRPLFHPVLEPLPRPPRPSSSFLPSPRPSLFLPSTPFSTPPSSSPSPTLFPPLSYLTPPFPPPPSSFPTPPSPSSLLFPFRGDTLLESPRSLLISSILLFSHTYLCFHGATPRIVYLLTSCSPRLLSSPSSSVLPLLCSPAQDLPHHSCLLLSPC